MLTISYAKENIVNTLSSQLDTKSKWQIYSSLSEKNRLKDITKYSEQVSEDESALVKIGSFGSDSLFIKLFSLNFFFEKCKSPIAFSDLDYSIKLLDQLIEIARYYGDSGHLFETRILILKN